MWTEEERKNNVNEKDIRKHHKKGKEHTIIKSPTEHKVEKVWEKHTKWKSQ